MLTNCFHRPATVAGLTEPSRSKALEELAARELEELSGRTGRDRLVVPVIPNRPEAAGMPPAPRSPLPADAIVQREWPPLRAAIVDIAAAMDRLDLAGAQEARTEAQSLLAGLLKGEAPERAELVLTRLSRGYDPAWRERFAAGETAADPPTDRG